ncbi:hypothetical protein [Rhodococcoides kyotonense]|uniref:hypothetical protein n=1 Tax=Rhodococcoides kyotonense TaxID=398843 RepID=UPI000ACACE27|nr:hypothetical protein [Rhodococcus kyotonensis]
MAQLREILSLRCQVLSFDSIYAANRIDSTESRKMHFANALRLAVSPVLVLTVLTGCSSPQSNSTISSDGSVGELSVEPAAGNRVSDLQIPPMGSLAGGIDYFSSDQTLLISGENATIRIDVADPEAPALIPEATLPKPGGLDGTTLQGVFITAAREGLVPFDAQTNQAIKNANDSGSCQGDYKAVYNPFSRSLLAVGADGGPCLNLFTGPSYTKKSSISVDDYVGLSVDGIASDNISGAFFFFDGKKIFKYDPDTKSIYHTREMESFVTGMVKRPEMNELALTTYDGVQFIDAKNGEDVASPIPVKLDGGQIAADSAGNIIVYSNTLSPISIIRSGSHIMEEFSNFTAEDFPYGRSNLSVTVSNDSTLYATDGYNLHIFRY